MSKKAIAVISFGTTYPKSRLAIERIENGLKEAFPEYDFYRAFTSKMVINKIEREENIQIPTPEELMQKLLDDGYEEVLCQSLHIMAGFEYEKMLHQLYKFEDKFQKLSIGVPMLFSEYDYEHICTELLQHMPKLNQDEAYVYMGHGTEHFANSVYSQVENMFRFLGAENVYVGTVEGFPNLDYVIKRLNKHNIKKVTLAPFMIVAGDHAQNDLAGDEEDSWKSILQSQGYKINVNLIGLGDLDCVCDLFFRHAKMALKG